MSEAVSTVAMVDALKWRYATKAFDPAKKIPAEIWSALEASLVLSPSSFGMQPWKFIVVTRQAVKDQLRPKAWGQSQVSDCSHFVVLARQSKVGPAEVNKLISTTATITGAPEAALEGYKKLIMGFVNNPSFDAGVWAAKQVYIALGFLMHSAALLKVDACPMEGFDAKAFDEILGLPATGFNSQVCCALGYRSPADKHSAEPKIRYSAAELIEHV